MVTTTVSGLAHVVQREARLFPRRSAALVALAAIVGLSNLAIPIFLERALDAMTGRLPEDILWPAVAALAAIGLGRSVVSWARDTLLRRLRLRRITEIDRALVDGAFRARRGALEPIGPGAAADAVASGDRIGAYLFGELPSVLAEAATGVALLVLLWIYDWRMGCLGIALAGWNVMLIWRLAARENRLGRVRAEAEAGLARTLESGLSALEAVQLAGAQRIALASWRRAVRRRSVALVSALTRGEAAAATQMTISAAAQALVLGFGGILLAISPEFSVGELFACSSLIFSINDPARRLLDAHAEASKSTAELLRRDTLRTLAPPAPEAEPHADRSERWRVAGLDAQGWKDLAAARPGSVLLTAPTELLPGSVAENVALFAPVDPERVERALGIACLDRELAGRGRLGPGGSDLSTGQRMRLGIARAICAEAPAILISGGLDYLDAPMAERLLQSLDAAGASLLIADAPLVVRTMPDWPLWPGTG